jgi:Domain of unknown function (DUF5666)
MKKSQLASSFLVCWMAGSALFAQDSSSTPQAVPNGGQAQPQAGAQSGGQERRRGGGGGDFQGLRELFRNATNGTIRTVTADGMTVKKMDGTTVTIKATKDTMFRRERQEAKLSDFKVGDSVIVAGDSAADNVVTAKLIALRPSGPNAMNPEDLGKKFIIGEITKIEDTKLTIRRPDGVDQVIEVDDDTSFKKGDESVTFADFKVGERVMGRGEVKNGTFVAATLGMRGAMGRGTRREDGSGTFIQRAPDGAAPPATTNNTPTTAPKRD